MCLSSAILSHLFNNNTKKNTRQFLRNYIGHYIAAFFKKAKMFKKCRKKVTFYPFLL